MTSREASAYEKTELFTAISAVPESAPPPCASASRYTWVLSPSTCKKTSARLHHGSHWCSCHAVVFPTESPAKQWECHAARTLPVTCVYLVACISHICDYECVTPTGNTHDHAGPCFITNVVSALGYEFKSPKKVRNKSSSYHNVTIKQLFRNL